MRFILSGQLTRLHRRVHRYVKKSQNTKRFVLMIIAVLAIVPTLSVNAADVIVSQVEPTVTRVTLDSTLEIERPTYSVEIRQSPYQQAKKLAQTRAVTIKVVTVSATDEEKRYWVERAAATWGIDWKILEAVWQVESGKQFYTAVRSYAGAQGPMQFMPGTWRSYAQDGNGDGVKNINDARDSLFSAAKLLAVNGVAAGNVDGALLRYNHSLSYVAKVKRIAASIGS